MYVCMVSLSANTVNRKGMPDGERTRASDSEFKSIGKTGSEVFSAKAVERRSISAACQTCADIPSRNAHKNSSTTAATRMTKYDFENKQLAISMTAGTHKRYHQRRWHYWTQMDRWFKIAVGFLAVAGACFAIVTMFHAGETYDLIGMVVAILAAIVAIVLNVFAFGEWASESLDLYRRWTDLREDIDDLLFDLDDSEPTRQDLVERLRRLEAKVHRICGSEPRCKQSLFLECYTDEKQSRQKVAIDAA